MRFDRNGQRRGGKRRNAGRKAKDPSRPSQRHLRRPEVDPAKPLHVTLRVVDAVGYPRKPRLFAAIRVALLFDGKLDPYSSAVFFAGWKERTVPVYIPPGYDPPKVCSPETWLLREGWKRAPAISVWEAP